MLQVQYVKEVPPVEKSIESFGFKVVDWNIDGDHLGGDKDQTGHNQPNQCKFVRLSSFMIMFSNNYVFGHFSWGHLHGEFSHGGIQGRHGGDQGLLCNVQIKR